jgi:uncharacterized protein YjbI with pentapeptide repeats
MVQGLPLNAVSMPDPLTPPLTSRHSSSPLDAKDKLETPLDLADGEASERALTHTSSISSRLDLRLDEIDAEAFSDPIAVSDDRDDLFIRASRRDVGALREFFDRELAEHGAKLIEIEFLGERLQLSLSGREVPPQDTLVPLIRELIVQLGLVKTYTVEVYGHRENCELPFWRSEFQPAELELAIPRQRPAPIKPVKFAFSTQSDPEASASGKTQALENRPSQASEKLEAILEEEPTSEQQQTSSLKVASSETQTSDAESPETQAKTQIERVIEDSATLEKRRFVETFLAQYAAGERAFAEIDLSETDLSGINLTLADLQSAQFVWANLQEASLYHVNLLGAKLRHANLKRAKLRSANLRGADFLNADLSEADLSWSNLTGANLTGANLTDANLKNAILDNVIMPDGTRLD